MQVAFYNHHFVYLYRSKKMSVPSSVISRVIGRGGCNINAIRDTTGAHIDIDTNRQKTTGSCIVTIKYVPISLERVTVICSGHLLFRIFVKQEYLLPILVF